jgi:hypothetical protein
MPDSPQQPPPGPPDIETAKWFEEIKRQDAHRAHDKADEFRTYVDQETGELTLRMALLINGGAAVSLLTFVGSLPVGRKHAVADSLVWFAIGVVLAVLGIGFAYFTNFSRSELAFRRRGFGSTLIWSPVPATPRYRALKIAFHVLAVLACLGSLAVFICGMLSVRNAFALL